MFIVAIYTDFFTPPKAFPKYPAAIRNAFDGKIGLALSGGGFRASLFHIGTLAKLAELDVLRHVEVLSCVSGGSVIGAHYYLKVRKLLESKSDAEVTKEDYIKIVEEIVGEFLEGVQRNIRVRVAAEFTTNLKMIFSSGYSRTKRAGELYEEEFFSKIRDGEGHKPRYMDELNIYPKADLNNFNPKLHNWRRAAKVPMLVLNAATLNTGHNWQFTTTWMGEPPSNIDTEVDTNDRLRRMYYSEAPEEHRKMRLGYAVSDERRVVVYCYPRTGRPGEEPPNGYAAWNAIPGARGCTPQSCAFRDYYNELQKLGAEVFGLSTQTTEYQQELVGREHLPFEILSDAELRFANALRLPIFEVEGETLLKRLTLIIHKREIVKVFYPVFPPDKNPEEVIAWLSEARGKKQDISSYPRETSL